MKTSTKVLVGVGVVIAIIVAVLYFKGDQVKAALPGGKTNGTAEKKTGA
jgi:hypothetical protein